jgi:hypothetical protein
VADRRGGGRRAPIRHPCDAEGISSLLVDGVEARDALLGRLEDLVALALLRGGLVRLLVLLLEGLPLRIADRLDDGAPHWARLIARGGLLDEDSGVRGGNGERDSELVQHDCFE